MSVTGFIVDLLTQYSWLCNFYTEFALYLRKVAVYLSAGVVNARQRAFLGLNVARLSGKRINKQSSMDATVIVSCVDHHQRVHYH